MSPDPQLHFWLHAFIWINSINVTIKGRSIWLLKCTLWWSMNINFILLMIYRTYFIYWCRRSTHFCFLRSVISFNLIEVKFKEAADRIFCGISWSVFPNYFFPYQSFEWVRWRVNEPISSWITKINSIPTFVLANANFIESHQSFGWFDFFFLSSNIIR